MLRDLKIAGTLLLIPFAVAAFLVLMIAAVLWYYLSTLAYLGHTIVMAVVRRAVPGSRLSGPHFAELASRKMNVD